jgi:hypothetical protein
MIGTTTNNNKKKAVMARAVPLGLDFHTLKGKRTDGGRTWWGEPKMSSIQQYEVVKEN